jgi:hypothetical protein
MLKFDEDISFTKTTSDEAGIFLERKSILHYKDDDVTSKLCNSLENKLKKYYEDRKDIEIEFDPYRSNSTFDIIIREFLLTSFDNGYDYFSIFSYFIKQFQFL